VEEKENYNKVGIPVVASISQGHVKDLFFFSSTRAKHAAPMKVRAQLVLFFERPPHTQPIFTPSSFSQAKCEKILQGTSRRFSTADLEVVRVLCVGRVRAW
jgi:hypothetical protein